MRVPRPLLALILAAALGGAAAACGGADDKPVASLEGPKGGSDVWILSLAPEKKISTIKAVRELTGLGLAEAKALVEGAPKLVKSAADRAEAEAYAKTLRDAGATIEIRAAASAK